MKYRIRSVQVPRYPVLLVTFDDGLSGEIDLSDEIGSGGIYEPLIDEDYFRTVKVDEFGHTFGWNLDQPGKEIDFCPDTARIDIEAAIVAKMADEFRANRHAAE